MPLFSPLPPEVLKKLLLQVVMWDSLYCDVIIAKVYMFIIKVPASRPGHHRRGMEHLLLLNQARRNFTSVTQIYNIITLLWNLWNLSWKSKHHGL